MLQTSFFVLAFVSTMVFADQQEFVNKQSVLARQFRDQSQQGLQLTQAVIAKYKAQQLAKASKKTRSA